MTESPATKAAEAATLDGVVQGDPAALRRWFSDQQDALYTFIYYRVGGDPHLAADALQATFTAALERLPDFDPQRGEMRTWLRYLSRNIIRSALADQRRGGSLQAQWDEFDQTLRSAYERIERQPLPEEVLEREETRRLVSITLSNLPPTYRDVLEAKYLDGSSLAKIADASETTIDSVKATLRRARAAFKECFLAVAQLEVSDV